VAHFFLNRALLRPNPALCRRTVLPGVSHSFLEEAGRSVSLVVGRLDVDKERLERALSVDDQLRGGPVVQSEAAQAYTQRRPSRTVRGGTVVQSEAVQSYSRCTLGEDSDVEDSEVTSTGQ